MTPLRRKTPLRSRSPRHSKLVAEWGRIKKRKVEAQIAAVGYSWCEMCRRPSEDLDLDHVEQASLGGRWDEGNARLLCRDCHRGRHETGR